MDGNRVGHTSNPIMGFEILAIFDTSSSLDTSKISTPHNQNLLDTSKILTSVGVTTWLLAADCLSCCCLTACSLRRWSRSAMIWCNEWTHWWVNERSNLRWKSIKWWMVRETRHHWWISCHAGGRNDFTRLWRRRRRRSDSTWVEAWRFHAT